MAMSFEVSRRFGARFRLNNWQLDIVGRRWLDDMLSQGRDTFGPHIRLPFCGVYWFKH